MGTKSILSSKTMWVNLIIAIVAFFPQFGGAVGAEDIAVLIAAANIILRIFTKDKVVLGLSK